MRAPSPLEGAEDFRSAANEHVVSDGGVALALVLASTAQGDSMVEKHIVSHFGGLADDDAHAVVNDEPAADLGPGVDLDACPEPVPLGDEPG